MRNLHLAAVIFSFSALFGIPSEAQQQSQYSAQQFNVQPINQAPSVTGAQAISDFENGSTVRFYFIITHLNSVVSSPTITSDQLGPATLSSAVGHRVNISWTAIQGATFDVLEASTSTLPISGNCNCAVATGITQNSAQDIGTYSSYSTLYTFGLNWNISQSINGGIPTLNFLYNGVGCSLNAAGSTTCASSGGSVSSVGLALPSPVMGVSGSPVTSSGVLTGFWNPESSNYVFAGPTAGSVGGVTDGADPVNEPANTTTLPFSLTPTTSTDFAIVVTASNFNIGVTTSIAGGGTWNNVVGSGGGTALYTQQLSTSAIVNPVVTSNNATTWSGGLALLKTTGTVTIVQTHSTSGAVNNGTVVTQTVTAGNSLLACVFGAINASPAPFITDSRNDLYTLLVAANIPDNTFSLNGTSATCWLTNNIPTGGSTIVTYNNNSHGVSGSFTVTELTGIAPDNGTPTFRPAVVADMPPAVQKLVNTPVSVLSFTNTPQSGDVTVTASATSVISVTITMPSSGCPCRPFISYSLYPSYAGVTNVPAQVIWVDDGSIQGNLTQTGESNASTGARTSITNGEYFPQTYTNGASITFTLFAQQDAGSTFLLSASPLFGPSVTANMKISLVGSN
jgi:hypothetical protein